MITPSKKKTKIEIRDVVLYARVSTLEQAERDLSLPAQLDALHKFCASRGYRIVEEYVEPGASGTDENRKVFRRMLEDVLAPSRKVQAVLVYQTSRFMRNAARARALKEQLRKNGVRVIAAGQETSDDPMGRIMEGLLELMDQYESEVNGLRTAAAMRENAKQGYFNGAHPPFGFRVHRAEVKPGLTRGKLVPNPAEVEVARELLRLYIGGSGAKSVAEELNRRGHQNRGRLWRKDMVLKILEETAAIGTFYWGKNPKNGTESDPDDWVPTPCEPIVERDLFETAQQIRSQRDPKAHPGRASSSKALLVGILKCGRCGSGFQVETSGKPRKTGETYRYYNCGKTFRSGKSACAGTRYRVERLDQAVLQHISERAFTPERCRAMLHDLVEETGLLRQRTQEQRVQFERELEDVHRKIQKWQLAFEAGELLPELGADRLVELKRRSIELEATLKKIVPLKPPPGYLYKTETIERFRTAIRELFLSDNEAVTRNYVRFLVERIEVEGREVRIFAKPEAAVQLMASGQKKTEVSASEPVLTSVNEWLPRIDDPRTGRSLVFRVVRRWSWSGLGLERVSQRLLRSMTPPANPVRRGRVYQAALAAQPDASYAHVARQFGVTREEVCQYVTVVRRLPANSLALVERETDARRLRRMSLRALLAIARLPDSSARIGAFNRLKATLPETTLVG